MKGIDQTSASRRVWVRMASVLVAAVLAATTSAAANAAGVTTVYAFAGGTSGKGPVGSPIVGADGHLWGGFNFGGAFGHGGIYRVAPDGSDYSVVYSFTGAADGAAPSTPLLRGQDGNYYGATSGNATSPAGYATVFRLTPGGGLTTLHTFADTGSRNLAAQLVQDADGSLYGTAVDGGSTGRGAGIVFRMNADGSHFAVLHDFGGGASGDTPVGLSLGPDGRLYGVVLFGGSSGEGVLYQLQRDGTGYQVLHEFDFDDGATPSSTLVFKSDGSLYGATEYGGQGYAGVIYRLDGAHQFSVIHHLTGSDGSGPGGLLVAGASDQIFGVAGYFGGADNNGTVFRLTTDGNNFAAVSVGADNVSPQGLALGADGKLYAAALDGQGDGTIFRTDPTAAFPALPPPPAPVVTLKASDPTVGRREFAELSWTSTGADGCTAAGDPSFKGSKPTAGSQRVAALTAGAHVYTLSCQGAGGTGSASVTVTRAR